MSSSTERSDAARLAKNEVFFRETNEYLEQEALARGRTTTDFICECVRRGCVDRLPITIEAYEQVRVSGGECFVVMPGHEDAAVERVVARYDGYVVVEKIGVAGQVARENDPR
jgi:hypothetical protein